MQRKSFPRHPPQTSKEEISRARPGSADSNQGYAGVLEATREALRHFGASPKCRAANYSIKIEPFAQ